MNCTFCTKPCDKEFHSACYKAVQPLLRARFEEGIRTGIKQAKKALEEL